MNVQLDRAGPTRRPGGKPQGYQQWRSLLFLHWEVAPHRLRPLVPAPLELDLFDGRAFVGLVPFAMQGVRPRGVPRWLGFRFLEANVRTYVSYGDQPGVYFLSLDASSRLAVQVARRKWNLPYYYAAMELDGSSRGVRYRSRREAGGAGCELRYRIGERLEPAAPESIDFYFLERYLLFVEREGRIAAGQVHHRPYPARAAWVEYWRDELIAAAGLPSPAGEPAYAHYADGVDVEVFGLRDATRFLLPPRKRPA